MSDDKKPVDVTKMMAVLRLPGMDVVDIRRDLPYGEAGTVDVYLPPGTAPGARPPVVVFIFGFPDSRFAQGFKHMGSYTSWARLAAASGLAAVTYTYRDPVSDIPALLRYLRTHAESLGIDGHRIGMWAASGNVPTALWLLMTEAPDAFRCAALLYGYMLDVPQGAEKFGLINPGAGRSIDELPPALPLFVARAGQDQTPGLNASLDKFVAAALARNLPLTLVNHARGPHTFDLFDDTEPSHQTIRLILAFLRYHLVPVPGVV
jgi:acetyl esterase/lipase